MPGQIATLELIRIEIIMATENVSGKPQREARARAVGMIHELQRAIIDKRARHLAEFHDGVEPHEEDET